MPASRDVRIHSFRVHVCRESGDRHFVGYVEAGDARFVFWNASELLQILRLEVGGDAGIGDAFRSWASATQETPLPVQ